MPQRRIAIIGSGFSGLCLGIQLKKAGIDAFAIFEKSDRLGGTWRDNTYPGAACDVPSSLYCFSFEQKTDWSRLWSPQEEIRDYMEHCARKYDLVRHIRFGTEIASQLIPQIASEARHLSIFQRSANWMLPRGDRAYTERERRWLARLPLL